MADGSADFTLRLRNQVTGPARAMSRSIGGLSRDMRAQQRSFAQGETDFQKRLKDHRRVSDRTHRMDLRSMREKRTAGVRLAAASQRMQLAQQRGRLQDRFGGIMRQRAAAGRLAQRRDVGFQRQQVRQREAESKARARARLLEGVGGSGGPSIAASVGAVVGVAALATAAVGVLATKFVGATFAAVDFGQRSKLALTALLGDGASATQQFEEVRREAQRFGLDVFDTVDSYRKLLTAQFDIKTARELVQRTSDLRALGSTAEEVKFALLAITQIKMKGKLQAEELTRQLANAGVSTELVYQELEKQLGKNREEILRMQQAGEIKADPAVRAIMDAIGRKTGGQKAGVLAETMATQKVGGIMARFKAQIQNAFISLGERVAPGLTTALQAIMASIQAAVASPEVKALGNAVVELFNVASQWAASIDLKTLIVDASTMLGNELRAASDWIRDNGASLRDSFVLFVRAMGTGMQMAVDFFKPFVAFAASDFGKFMMTPLNETFDGKSMVERTRARLDAPGVPAATKAGASMAGNKFGDIKFGDINVNLNGSSATPEGAGGETVDSVRKQMMAMLNDL